MPRTWLTQERDRWRFAAQRATVRRALRVAVTRHDTQACESLLNLLDRIDADEAEAGRREPLPTQ